METVLIVALLLTVIAVYFGLAIFAFRLAGKWLPRGIMRPIARASVITFFFAIGGVSALPLPSCVASPGDRLRINGSL